MSGISNPPRVLAIHAHPDDVEFQCAGTLARLRQAGASIAIATMTPGDCGSMELGPEEIANLRRAEAQKSAALIEADYFCLEFRDLCIVHDNPSRRRVTEFLRRLRPDVVITAPAMDYMSDHELTSHLVRDACFNASVPNYATMPEGRPAEPLDKIPCLYYVDPIEGSDYYGNRIEPGFVVDITATFELKQQMLACHASQRSWLLKQHGMDEYLASCERWSAARGKEIGVAFAEGFTQHTGHPYPSHNYLAELLSD
jgi:LmbE family N-acetylglucosaminyl deacetylase